MIVHFLFWPQYDKTLIVKMLLIVWLLLPADVGADVLDLTGQGAATFGKLEEEDVHYELSPHQRRYFEMVHEMNAYVRSEYHALHDFLWRSGLSSMAGNMPKR